MNSSCARRPGQPSGSSAAGRSGSRNGSARYEAYEGVPANTILKQFPPAGYPLSRRDVVSLTVSQSASAIPAS